MTNSQYVLYQSPGIIYTQGQEKHQKRFRATASQQSSWNKMPTYIKYIYFLEGTWLKNSKSDYDF